MSQGKRAPAEQYMFDQAALERGAANISVIYNSGAVKQNPDGKPLAQWTVDDIKGKFITSELNIIRAIIQDERYDLVDRIKPTAMSRSEFSRAVLRELAKRGELKTLYDRRFSDVSERVATVQRPLQVPPANQRTVTGDVVTIALSDAATNAVVNPLSTEAFRINIENDVAAQIGLPVQADGKLSGIDTRTDTAAYDLGYTVGALPQFRRGAPFEKGITFREQDANEINEGYCVVVNEIFAQSGRSLNQREVFTAGFSQGRSDARTNFQGREAQTGLFDLCPARTPAPTEQDLAKLALR